MDVKNRFSIFLSWPIFIILAQFITQGTSQCREANTFIADPQQCDAYVECKDGVPFKRLCPEGLYFNDYSHYPRYPCSYPGEVSCGSRSRTQPANPTAECQHQYGLFKAEPCGTTFTNCIAGKAHKYSCPEGLVFNEAKVQCVWPDEMPGCDPSAIFRFSCPGVRVEADLGHPRYSDSQDCRKFYVCIENTKPRAHTCGIGFVFNPELGVCDEPENVPKCEVSSEFYTGSLTSQLSTTTAGSEDLGEPTMDKKESLAKNLFGFYSPNSYSAEDPSMNVSVFSSGASKLSPYLNVDPYISSEPEFILPEGANRTRGRFEFAFGTIGGSVLAGGTLGGLYGLYRGLSDTQGQVGKIRRTQLLNYVGKQGASTANSLGIVALMYSGLGCILSWMREKDDDFNTIGAATATGLLYKSTSGLRKCGMGGAVGFGLAAAYTLWTKGQKDRSLANYVSSSRYTTY